MHEFLLTGKRWLRLPLMLCLILLAGLSAKAQDRVSGTVKDDQTGEVLPGVSVIIKGTTTGTVTDGDGRYTLAASGDAILSFSFVGYATKDVPLNGQTTLDVVLASDIKSLEEVVVVGYGEEKKSLVTGAISSVKADQLKSVSIGTIDRALQGRMAGVNVTPASGSPGAAMKIRIRGVSSNGSSDPLYIVDGVRIPQGGGIEYLNPSDIASIEVLKDAASAAIYGAEGANGVIIVTTKSGKANTTEISYTGQYSVQSARPNLMPMMNAQQYQQYLSEAGTAGGPAAADVTDPVGTNWVKSVMKNAPQQNHTINFSGGTDAATFLLSAGYFNQQGIIGGKNAFYERYSFRANSDYKIKPWLSVGEKLSYVNINRNGIDEDSEFGGILASAISLDPLTPIVFNGTLPSYAQDALDKGNTLLQDNNGQYYGISPYVLGEYGNPVARINRLATSRTNQNKVVGSFYTDINLAKGLKFTSRFGVDAAFQRQHKFTPTFYFNVSNANTLAAGADTWDMWFNWQWENFLTYTKSFGEHNLTVLAGVSDTKRLHHYLNGTYGGFFKEGVDLSYASNAPDANDKVNSYYDVRTLASLFARVNYDFKGKYQFSATIRRDGSSMLAAGNQWGTFPSVSAGWILSNEDFFSSASNIVSFAKVRASWGQNGSISNLSPGMWKGSISPSDYPSPGNSAVIIYPSAPDAAGNVNFLAGAAQSQLENPKLKWETSEQFDVGADLKFVENRVSLTVDYFNKKTKDLITGGVSPGWTGLPLPFVNAGDVLNRGVEIELGYQNKSDQALQYSISGNLTTIHNEVTAMNPQAPLIPGATVGTGWAASYMRQGYPIWGFNGYKTAGIFQNQAQIDQYVSDNNLTGYAPKPGDPIIVNTNGDNQISPADQTYIGNPMPKFYYGARLTMNYKNFDLLVFLQGQYGNQILMGFIRTDRPTANKPEFFYNDRWTGDGSSNTWFGANTSDTYTYSSDKMVFNGSYARLRQLQLGYTLPGAIAKSIKIKTARVYVSFDNYFTFTKYKGLDPEAGSNNNNSIGIDRGVYPVPRTFTTGLSFTF